MLTINTGNAFEMHADKISEESQYAKIVKTAAAIVFGDRIRPRVRLMMQSLRNLGVKQTVMLTGDSSDNAQKIAQQTGITHFESDLLPDQKVKSVKN